MNFLSLKGLLLLSTFSFSVIRLGLAQEPAAGVPRSGKQETTANAWVEGKMRAMSLEEKIGQLFMLAAFSNREPAHEAYIERMVRQQHLGGLIFMQGTPERQRELVTRYQTAAKVPLLIGQDAEWGPAMRLKGMRRYPYQMTMGAVRNDSLLYFVGESMAAELKAVGINVSFSPVVDVNNNPDNPVINYRSFGANKYNVARKGLMLADGLQDGGVMACAKHFPGHGDTGTDSHYALPVIGHSPARLDSVELYPFHQLVRGGVQATMVAHLYVPAIDNTPNVATTLSPKVVQGVLREKMGFEGLIITDALNMHGVSKYYSAGETALKAFLAGNDILLFPQDVPTAARLIKNAIADNTISMEDLDTRVRRILTAKYKLRLHRWTMPTEEALAKVRSSKKTSALRKQLYEAAMTLVKNDNDLLPIKDLANRKIAYVQIGGGSRNHFDEALKKYGEIKPFYLRRSFTEGEGARLLQRLEDYNTVIIGVMGMTRQAKDNYSVKANTAKLCAKIAASSNYESALTIFGNPYALSNFGKEDAILVAYEAVAEAEQAAAAAIFGGIAVDGVLPVTVNDQFKEGRSIQIREPIRFGFSLPEERGMDSRTLNQIDGLANSFIQKGAMPGCAILVMKGNQVVYDKGFGRMSYHPKSTRIDPYQHTYDIASITKVAATVLLTMQMVENKTLNLDSPIKKYLPELKGTNKAEITIRRLLQHNAGLPGWVPFYKETMIGDKKKTPDPEWYSYSLSPRHRQAVAPDLYADPGVHNLVWRKVIGLDVRKTTKVRYSDIGLIILWKILERQSGRKMDWLAENLLYKPMGMNNMFFKPFEKGRITSCPPTEMDTVWRNAMIQGYVHDPAAAILGGVAGHAGLFANVYDLGKLMLMLKNGGYYGGESYLQPSTIKQFTAQQLTYNRRGLGWDKPEFNQSRNRRNPASDYASKATFGHTGFTGTCVWVDPKYDLIYVFLSNRVYPQASNRLLIYEHVRERIMDQVYASIFNYRKAPNYGETLEWRHSRAASLAK
ncbi:MAG: glycoside hydrolase family 3 N-terminal domain-containing protein [Bacteroidota bacterium]